MDKHDVITIRLDLCELKSKVLNIALFLEDDKNYTCEHAVIDLFKVVKHIEMMEKLKILNKAT